MIFSIDTLFQVLCVYWPVSWRERLKWSNEQCAARTGKKTEKTARDWFHVGNSNSSRYISTWFNSQAKYFIKQCRHYLGLSALALLFISRLCVKQQQQTKQKQKKKETRSFFLAFLHVSERVRQRLGSVQNVSKNAHTSIWGGLFLFHIKYRRVRMKRRRAPADILSKQVTTR